MPERSEVFVDRRMHALGGCVSTDQTGRNAATTRWRLGCIGLTMGLAISLASTIAPIGSVGASGTSSNHVVLVSAKAGCPGSQPAPGDRCVRWPVTLIPQMSTGADNTCAEALFMRVKLSSTVASYEVLWSWTEASANPSPADPWTFTSDGVIGSGPYGEQIFSKTAITPKNSGVNVHYRVPRGYGAWFISAGGGQAPCPVKTGVAHGWAWIKK